MEVVLNRPLQAAVPLSYSHFYEAEGLAPSSFEPTENNCVCHQLALQTEVPLEEIEAEMDEVLQELPTANKLIFEGKSWREVGITAKMLLMWAAKRQTPCHIMWGGDLIQSHRPINGNGGRARCKKANVHGLSVTFINSPVAIT